MGYYYDWVARAWVEKSHAKPTPRRLRLRVRRRSLLQDLITELKHDNDDSVIRLYASMLARSLLQSDEELMKEFGRLVADLNQESVKKGRG